MADKTEAFRIGEIVWLNSGGPPFTIIGFPKDMWTGQVSCSRSTWGSVDTHMFDPACLTRIDPNTPMLHDRRWLMGMAMGECIRQSFMTGQAAIPGQAEHVGVIMDRAAAWAERAAEAAERRQKQSKRETK